MIDEKVRNCTARRKITKKILYRNSVVGIYLFSGLLRSFFPLLMIGRCSNNLAFDIKLILKPSFSFLINVFLATENVRRSYGKMDCSETLKMNSQTSKIMCFYQAMSLGSLFEQFRASLVIPTEGLFSTIFNSIVKNYIRTQLVPDFCAE